MPAGFDGDAAWIPVLPSMKNFLASLRGQASAAAATAGTEAGRVFGNSMAEAVSASTAKLQAAQKRAQDAAGQLSVAQARLNELRDAGTASAARMAAAEESVAKAQRNVELQSQNVARAEKAQTRTQAELAASSELLVTKNRTMEGSMARVTGVAGVLSGAMAAVNRAYSALFAASLLALPTIPFIVAAKDAGNYQQNLVKLVTTAGESRANLSLVGDAMLKMAGQVGIGANELAVGMYIIESSGQHGAKALDTLKAAAQGARQENADLGTVANAVSTIMHDYGEKAGSAADVTSKLIAAVAHGKTTFQDFTASLHSITPLAAALKIPLSDIVGSLAAMTQSGETADQATENMRNALMTLQAPSQQMLTELGQIGISAQQLSEGLSQKGLAGTMQQISQAILTKMGPSAHFMLDAFNKTQSAAEDLKIQIGAMPASIQKLSQGLLDGSVSVKNYRADVRDLGGHAAALGLNFLQSFTQLDGFNSILRSGKPEVQTYSQALQKAVGTTAGLSVALQLTHQNALNTNKTIEAVSKASADAKGNIEGWTLVQGTFNQKMAEAKASMQTVAIELGRAMLPALSTFAGFITSTVVPGLERFGHTLSTFFHSAPFQDFLHGMGTIIHTLIDDIGRLIASFVSSGGLHDALVIIGTVAMAAWKALQFLAQVAEAVIGGLITLFTKIPGPVQAVVLAFAALRIAFAAGIFDAFLLRGLYLIDFFKKLAVGAAAAGAAMVASFRASAAAAAFSSEIQGASVAASRFVGAMSGIGAAAGTAARGGLAAMRGGLKGIVDFLGGAWVVGILAAAVLIGFMVHAVQAHDEAVKKATADVQAYYKAITLGGEPAKRATTDLQKKQDELAVAQEAAAKAADAAKHAYEGGGKGAAGYGAALHAARQKVADLTVELGKGEAANAKWAASQTPVELATQRVSVAQHDLAMKIKEFGPNSFQAVAASQAYQQELDKQKKATGDLSAAEQTHLDKLNEIANKELGSINAALAAESANLQLKDAITNLNQGMADGTLKGNALTEAQNALEQQAISTATAAGAQAAAQAKTNGITDDGTLANAAMLDSLKKTADATTGPVHDAIVKQIQDLQNSIVTTGNLTDTTGKMGLNVVGTWDNNTRVIKGATDQQIQDLQGLGYEVIHLPNGQVVVTSDTGPARAQLDQLIADYKNKQIAIAGPTAGPAAILRNGQAGGATGGRIVGPGTGTSDSIPIRASNNEWIIQESSTALYGHDTMASVNAGTATIIPGFAAGGLVSGPLYHGPASPNPAGIALGGLFHEFKNFPAQLSAEAINGIRNQISTFINQLQTAQATASFTGGGGGGGSPLMRALGLAIAGSMGYGAQFPAIDYIFTHESGWNPNAQNPTSTAYGIPQFLNSTWGAYGGKTSNAATQIRDGIMYMRDRYGSPNAAASFWASHHWYDKGGLWPSGTIGVNESGGDERVFTPQQDNYFKRFVDGNNTAAAHNGTPHWHFYLGDREITDLVDARMEYRDDKLSRDVRSSL